MSIALHNQVEQHEKRIESLERELTELRAQFASLMTQPTERKTLSLPKKNGEAH